MVPFYNVFGMTRSFIENEPGTSRTRASTLPLGYQMNVLYLQLASMKQKLWRTKRDHAN